MSVEENKTLVRNFIAMFSASRVDEAFATLADDFHWQTWGSLPFSGRNDKRTVRMAVDGLRDAFETKPAWIVDHMIAEGDAVAVECHTVGDTRGGFEYRNHYHLAVSIRNGLITEIREYMDTQHCMDLVRAVEAEATSRAAADL